MLRLAALCCAAAAAAGLPSVLVTGATGRTGSLIYLGLKSAHPSMDVRALVRSVEKARRILGCDLCNASEGIYVGDVTNETTLMTPARGISTLVIAVGVDGNATEAQARSVEFGGVQKQVTAIAQPANRPGCVVGYNQYCGLRTVLVSSMGTTLPAPSPAQGGTILFWKLNAEAFLGYTGFPSVVIKPGGLLETPGNASTLMVGHDDSLLANVSVPVISRADVAAVAREAALEEARPATGGFLRFDVCGKPGPPTAPSDVLQAARHAWQRGAAGGLLGPFR